MAWRSRPRTKRAHDFRPSSVHQHQQTRTIKPSARELFPKVRPPGRRVAPADGRGAPALEDAEGRPVKVVEFGPPTFRNVIDEQGRWV